jgi:hypothetical protein
MQHAMLAGSLQQRHGIAHAGSCSPVRIWRIKVSFVSIRKKQNASPASSCAFLSHWCRALVSRQKTVPEAVEPFAFCVSGSLHLQAWE